MKKMNRRNFRRRKEEVGIRGEDVEKNRKEEREEQEEKEAGKD